MATITTVIVDDEPLARAAAAQLLALDPDLVLAGEAADGRSALALLRRVQPDLVLLDLDLPDQTGLGLLGQLPEERRPEVIFMTAHGEFARQAFDVHAVDYLMKPCTDARFREAVARLRRRRGRTSLAALAAQLDSLLQRVQAPPPARTPDRLTVRSGGELHVFATDQIKWVEGQGDYLKIHGTGGSALVRETMRHFLGRVDPARFVRVHKSAIVNLAFVRRLEPIYSGDYRLELQDNTVLRVSRNYRTALRAALG